MYNNNIKYLSNSFFFLKANNIEEGENEDESRGHPQLPQTEADFSAKYSRTRRFRYANQ